MIRNPLRSLGLPVLLLTTAALAACETTGSTASGPTAAAPAQAGAPAPRDMTDAERAQMEQVLQVALPQIERCITPFAAAARERNIGEVEFLLEFEPDGTPRGMGINDPERIDVDPNYRHVIEVLVNGMRSCPPLQGMPAGSYQMWEYLPITYNAMPA